MMLKGRGWPPRLVTLSYISVNNNNIPDSCNIELVGGDAICYMTLTPVCVDEGFEAVISKNNYVAFPICIVTEYNMI